MKEGRAVVSFLSLVTIVAACSRGTPSQGSATGGNGVGNGGRGTVGATSGGGNGAGGAADALHADATPSGPWQMVSVPDFLNADVADISGLTSYDGGGNSSNVWHETAIGHALDAIASEKPDFVLVAGDLVNGHWYDDNDNRSIFGPCTDVATKRASVRSGGDFYYARWQRRFDERDLVFHTAVGDHDVGDNPWPPGDDKSYLLDTYRSVYASHTTKIAGTSRYQSRPVGTPYADTAYAFRHRNVLVATVDVFHQADPTTQLSSEGTVQFEVEGGQLEWLRKVLDDARADPTVDHIVVQGHVPVLWPVRGQNSSMLRMSGGAASPFWQTLEDHGVTLYLAGEVHDMTAAADGGVDQVVHGGIMGYAPNANYLVIKVDGKRLDLTLKRIGLANDASAGQLWQMAANRPNAKYEVDPAGYQIVGTLTIDTSSGQKVYSNRTGYFEPYTP